LAYYCEPHLCLLKIWSETESRVEYFSPAYRYQRSDGTITVSDIRCTHASLRRQGYFVTNYWNAILGLRVPDNKSANNPKVILCYFCLQSAWFAFMAISCRFPTRIILSVGALWAVGARLGYSISISLTCVATEWTLHKRISAYSPPPSMYGNIYEGCYAVKIRPDEN